MSKDYPASEHKLKLLRQRGIFPQSRFLQNSFKIITLIFSIFFVIPNLISINDFKFFLDFNHPFYLYYKNFFKIIFKLCVIPACVLSLSFFFGLLQTKFFFSPALAKADFSRYRKNFSISHLIYYMLIVFLLLVVLFKSCFSDLTKISELAVDPSDNSFLRFRDLLFNSNVKYTAYFIIFGMLSYMFDWWFFRKKHMMTKQELEAENREQQSPRYYRGN